MTYAETYPAVTPIEQKIKLLLVMEGYNKDDIQFRGDANKRYLRYKYWEYIKPKSLTYVERHAKIQFEFFEIEDDDCLIRYGYDIRLQICENGFLDQTKRSDVIFD